MVSASGSGRHGGRRSGRAWLVPIGVVASGLVAAAVLPLAASAASAPKATSSRVVEEAKRAKLGTILVTTRGMTLYHYTLDKGGKAECTGECAVAWPPLVLPAGVRIPTGGSGVTGLGTVRDPDGKLQVTWHGEPLYRFAGDKKAGSANGEGLLGRWFVVKPAATKATTSKPVSTGSGRGY